MAYKNIKVIAFDADDTLWVNETYFREAEKEFAKLLGDYQTEEIIDRDLFKKEISNLKIYGYGIKGFVLSMIEYALELSNYQIDAKTIEKIIAIGKEMLNKPIELLKGVEEVLEQLAKEYTLIVVTKGDLLDQEKKLEASGLLQYFYQVEVLSDKKVTDYRKLLKKIKVKPSEFLMIGNSLKSDVLPAVEIGGEAIHIPFHTTWAHETVPQNKASSSSYITLKEIKDVLAILS